MTAPAPSPTAPHAPPQDRAPLVLPRDASPRAAAAAAGAALFALYAATAARGVTFWDAGEFLAAIATLGIPHPPGTPLFVLAARAWTTLLPGVSFAFAVALFAAACSAGAGALLAWLFARWSGRTAFGVAAAVVAGSAASVWLNATEAEVYAPSLLLAALQLVAAERRAAGGDARWTVLLVYLMALAIPLHLSALVAAPAAIVLALRALPRGEAVREGAVLAGALLLAAGAGRASPWLAGLGALALLIALVRWRGAPAGTRAMAAAVVPLALSALLVLLVRALHDPAVNQGNPATLGAVLDVVARRQYVVAPPWPRQAPLWLQLGNLFQWADWQWALGLSSWVGASLRRTPVTVVMLALALVGAIEHRRRHRPSWYGWLVLLLSSSLGVLLYLNLKAGPSYGWGLLAADAPHEARERDYFFALAFWAWGAWAALGAMRLVARAIGDGRGAALAGLALCAAPIAMNWRAVSRRSPIEAQAPRALASVLLESAPPRAVLLVAGDNDTYPLWYLQQVERVRRDVTVLTLPLLGAPWYRAELARRDSLVPADLLHAWPGTRRLVSAIAVRAAAANRPLVAAASVESDSRAAAEGHWVLEGALYRRELGSDPRGPDLPPRIDADAAARAWARVPAPLRPVVGRLVGGDPSRPPEGLRASTDPTTAIMLRVLACVPAAARGTADPVASDFLATRCNYR